MLYPAELRARAGHAKAWRTDQPCDRSGIDVLPSECAFEKQDDLAKLLHMIRRRLRKVRAVEGAGAEMSAALAAGVPPLAPFRCRGLP